MLTFSLMYVVRSDQPNPPSAPISLPSLTLLPPLLSRPPFSYMAFGSVVLFISSCDHCFSKTVLVTVGLELFVGAWWASQ